MLSDCQIQRLLDIAFAGCHTGNVPAARQIYGAVLALRPQSASARIGQAFSHIVVNEFAEAEGILRDQVLAANPEDSEALALLGLSCMLDGRTDEAVTIFKPLAEKEGPGSTLSRELLESLP